MLRKKWALYVREIIKDGSCVNQNVTKRNMEARNNYLLEKKETEKKARINQTKYPWQLPLKKIKKQLRLEAITDRLAGSMIYHIN